MMCNHSPRESYSLCEWDHNRPSFAFNSQSDNTLHVHMGWVCACVFPRLTPRWLHGWAWTDVPTGAELPDRAETWTLMRRWQNSLSPIKESEWIPFKTGGLGRMRNDKDIPQGRAMVWCDASWRSCGVLEGITRRGMKSLITNLVVKAIKDTYCIHCLTLRARGQRHRLESAPEVFTCRCYLRLYLQSFHLSSTLLEVQGPWSVTGSNMR